jgi:4-hydroxy-tetrahydrodipicolinate synthase
MRPYEGLLTAMVTPFRRDDLAVDEDAAVALGRHLLAHGSHGLVICATTGEATTMSDEEQGSLIELMVSELGGEGVVNAGAGSNDTRHACHLTERAAAAGAHAILSVCPYYNKPNRRGIVRHFEEVARAAGGTPVIVYNIPSRCVINMPPDLLAELAQIEGIEAVKQANNEDLQPIDGLYVLAGNDDIYLRTLQMGGAGCISVAAHIVGDEMRRMWDEPNQREAIDASLRDLYTTLFITSNPIPLKAALNLIGHDVGVPRLPLVEASPEEQAEVRAMLERHGLLSPAHAG